MRRILLAGAVVWAAMFVAPLEAATSYTYDTLGRLWVVTYDNGYQITYNYDSAGNRTSVVTQSGASRPAQANNEYITVFENGLDTIDPRSIATNPDGGTLTVTSVGSASHGTASLISGSNPVKYVPNASYTGNDSFVYAISDTSGHASSATVYVTVTNVGPVANSDNVSMPMNAGPVNYLPLANDVEPVPADSLWIYSVGSPAHGTVGIVGTPGTSLTYTPTANYMGVDSFPYTITDVTGLQSTATETITIGNPPVAVDDYILTAVATPITYDPLVNDSDPNGFPISIATVGPSSNSSRTNVGGAAILYTPNTGFSGPDTFTYTISDGYLTANANEHVCVGSPLTAVDQHYSIILAATTPWIPTLPLTGGTPPDPRTGAADACSAPFTVSSVGTASPQGTAIVDPGGTSISYSYGTQVNAGNSPLTTDVTFTYTLTDSYGATATATIHVHIHVTCCS